MEEILQKPESDKLHLKNSRLIGETVSLDKGYALYVKSRVHPGVRGEERISSSLTIHPVQPSLHLV